MYSVTNNRGFVPQSEQFEDREMVGEDIKAYKIIHNEDFAYNPARINVGSIAKYDGEKPCMISSLYVCFKTAAEIDNDWMMQLLRTPKMNFYYNINGEGGVRIYLFYPNFARIKTSYPDIAEQTKIAKFLALLDQRIATQRKIIDKLETLIRGIADELFSYKNANEVHLLGDLCKISTGKLDANQMTENGWYPFFTCAAKPFRIDTFAFDTEALLISGNGANLGYINYYKGKFNAYQRTYVLSDFCADIQYVQYYLESHLHKRISLQKNSGNTPYIVLSTLTDMPIALPDIESQIRYSKVMRTIKEKLDRETILLNHYLKIKQYLLSNMFI